MKTLATIVALGFLSSNALSSKALADKVPVAANSPNGTYSRMLSELARVCSTPDFTITEDKSITGGALGNLEALKSRAHMAFVQSDVIQAFARADDFYKQYKTLVSLYPEEVHVLALRTPRLDTGGFGFWHRTSKEFNKLSDLAGLPVGATGGATLTMRLLNEVGGAGFIPLPFETGDALIGALQAGAIQAAIFVGGAPLPDFERFRRDDFKLLSVDDSIAVKTSSLYRPTKITYTNLEAQQISTIAAKAIILSRPFKTRKFVNEQITFRRCLYDNLDMLKEAPGFHFKWQFVDPNDHGPWEWLELPDK